MDTSTATLVTTTSPQPHTNRPLPLIKYVKTKGKEVRIGQLTLVHSPSTHNYPSPQPSFPIHRFPVSRSLFPTTPSVLNWLLGAGTLGYLSF